MEPENTPQKRGEEIFQTIIIKVFLLEYPMWQGLSWDLFHLVIIYIYMIYVFQLDIEVRHLAEASGLDVYDLYLIVVVKFYFVLVFIASESVLPTPPGVKHHRNWGGVGRENNDRNSFPHGLFAGHQKKPGDWRYRNLWEQNTLFEVDDQIEKKDSSKVGFWRFVQVFWKWFFLGASDVFPTFKGSLKSTRRLL